MTRTTGAEVKVKRVPAFSVFVAVDFIGFAMYVTAIIIVFIVHVPRAELFCIRLLQK